MLGGDRSGRAQLLYCAVSRAKTRVPAALPSGAIKRLRPAICPAGLKNFFTISRSVSLSLTVWKSCRMAENHMEWLREHMRNHIDGEGAIEPAETVLSFRRAPAGGPRNQDTEAVALVYQAADVVKG